MKKLIIYIFAMVAVVVSGGALAGTVIDAGTFSENGDTYTPSPYSGLFTDSYHLDIETSGLLINFSGSHQGMAGDDLLLTNINDETEYHLAPMFSETLSLGVGSYVFTLSGFALNALDSKVHSDYDLVIKAVPLPAAVWLFGSALIGFISFSVRRKI